MIPAPSDLTKEDIVRLLDTRDDAVEKAILRIYERQTADEQATQSTRYENGVGFNGADAALLSYLARWIEAHPEKPLGRRLSGKWKAEGRRRIRKYAGQLLSIAKEGR